MSSDELPTQRVAGTEYRSCEWCGAAVSQLGTRTPRLYCKRSHRQRAYDARRYGEPMLRERQDVAEAESAAPARAAVPDPPAAAPVVLPMSTPPRPASPRSPAESQKKPPRKPRVVVRPEPEDRPRPQPTMPLPDMTKPRSQRGSLFPPLRRQPEQPGLFDDQEQAEG